MNVYGVITGTVGSSGAVLGYICTARTVSGDLSIPTYVGPETYGGEYTVTPRMYEQVLETANKRMAEDVTVLQIPYYEVGNESGGTTVYIAMEG